MPRHDRRENIRMRNPVFYVCIIFLALLAVPIHSALQRASAPPPVPAKPERIVSLAPSVTETLYALGLGPKVAGVTQFCTYPPEVAAKPRVAGFSEIAFEALVRVRPDLAALPVDKIDNKIRLERLGIPVLTLDTRSLAGLMTSIKTLGEATGSAAKAEAILREFQEGLRAARERASGKDRPRVLFAVMHTYQGLGYLSEIHVVGQDGFYNEMIEAAGGVNAYQGNLAFPRLSRESILFLNPDVIVDVIPVSENRDAARRDWESMESVTAIRNNRLHLLTDNADTVPGPRSLRTLQKLSLAFHPAPSRAAQEAPDD